jgi:hypothetical protein
MQVHTAISEVSVIFMGPSPDIIDFLFKFFNIYVRAEEQVLHFPNLEEKP